MTCFQHCVALAAVFAVSAAGQGARKAAAPKSPRLYVFDCGTLDNPDTSRYSLQKEEVATHLMSDACFLVAHPRGTLMWDTGPIPDGDLKAGAGKLTFRGTTATVTKPLLPQLASAGYAPADVTYVAFSHFHWDHVANANSFGGATWLVPAPERDIMFAEPPSERTIPATFSALRKSKTVILQASEHDVFGDGSVLIKASPGHSPGHQVLFLKLASTGPVVLSGDLYHYPEERTKNRLPTTEFNREQTVKSRAELEAFLKKTGAQLWIQHDYTANSKLKKAPAFYE